MGNRTGSSDPEQPFPMGNGAHHRKADHPKQLALRRAAHAQMQHYISHRGLEVEPFTASPGAAAQLTSGPDLDSDNGLYHMLATCN